MNIGRNKFLVVFVVYIILFAVLLNSFSPAACVQARSNLKFAIVFAEGGLGDKSFSDSANMGRLRAIRELNVDIDYAEPMNEKDIEKFQRDFAKKGVYKVIICIGYSQKPGLLKVAKEFPDQKFAIIDEVVDLPNVSSFLFKEEEGSFLCGVLAGLLVKDKGGTIGFIGGMDIPLIQKFYSGYKQGAEYANPEVKILKDFVGSWNDAKIAKKLAHEQYNKGAEVIYIACGAGSLGVIEAAKERENYAIGIDSDQDYLGCADPEKPEPPTCCITSMMKCVDVAVYNIIESYIDGTLKGGEVIKLGLAVGGVGLSRMKYTSLDDVPKEMRDEIKIAREKIRNGEIEVKV